MSAERRSLLQKFRPVLTGGAILLAVSCLLFQNCLGPTSAPGSGDGGSSVPLPSTIPQDQSGNGTGYGGKLVVELLADGSVCPDFTTVSRRIELLNSSTSGPVATLIRDKCADLPPDQTVSLPAPADSEQPTVVVDGKEYQLEALLGNGRGKFVRNLAGDYAPSLASTTLPPATSIEGAPLGTDHLLVAISQQESRPSVIGSEIILYLHRKSGIGLEMRQELHVPLATTFGISDYRTLLGAFAFDDNYAVVFVRTADPFAARSLLIKRTGESIAVVDDSLALGNVRELSGHPLDADRYLLTYQTAFSAAPPRIGLRVISRQDDRLQFGAPLLVDNIAPQPTGPTSLLPTASSGVFDAYSANTNYDYGGDGSPTGDANMIHFTVRVDGTTVSGGSDSAPFGSTTDLLASALDFVGDAANALITFKSPASGFSWAKLFGSAYQVQGQIASTAGNYVGPMNMAGASNLRVGGRSYFRLPTDTGTRIYFLDSLDSQPRLYNTAFPRAKDFNMSKLFNMGADLVLLEAETATTTKPLPGHVHVLSTPP